MRNLKKILALVLAVVMSLSLMATAGAAGSTAETINEDYKTATDVLQALKVFKGYEDGTFKPQQSITRAEVATILYRIVTGDVESARSDIYTDMQSTKFTDLAGATWATGYINYCANAKLIVGVGGNKFMPSANITGYATLAMILRALGYDKNGEFQGSGWEIRTASTARELGILKNVSQDALGSAASREMVAELLFRAMLCDKVQYNALIQDYTKTGTTLGYEVFTLEEVEGVVVANEYADLRRDANGKGTNKTAAAGTTVLRNDDGKDYTVTTASGLDDLGETRVAYTVENGKRATYDLRNVKLDNPDKDDIVYDGGEEFSSIASKISGNEAEHYVNFGEDFSDVTTTIKVTYQARMISRRVSALSAEEARKAFVDLYNLTGLQGTNLSADLPNHLIATPTYLGSGSYDIVYIPAIGDIARSFTSDGHTYSIVNITENGAQVPYYKVEIAPGSVFTSFDESMVTAIFNRADRLPDGAVVGALVVTGEVFRGTQSVYDYSDWRSYEEFRADCLKESEENTQVTSNGKGYWLKIIDNDKDGVTDWVFQTRYTVASVSSVKDGVPTLEAESTWGSPDGMNVLSRASSTTDESGDLAVGDVVYYAVIDGVARAWKADVVEVRANTINRNNKTVTTSDGTVYEESANHEHSTRSDIASHVVNMSGTTNYSLYLDKYGYLAAFSQNIAGKFVLLVNGWARNVINGTEYAVTAWDSETRGYNVYNVTSGGGLFVDNASHANEGVNSWYRIRHFHDLNCDLVGGADTTDDVLSMVAYMETDGENATLIPVDTIYDVEDQNNRGYRMIDMGTVIPDSNLRNGTLYTTTTSALQPYNLAGAAGGVRVRALADTTYYYVYNNQRTTVNETLGVHQATGYEAGASWLTAAQQALYVEDVYVVGRQSTDVYGTFYTANVVVVELNDEYRPNHLDLEQVFIYDFPAVGTWATIEEVSAIRADGSNATLKIDLTASRTYTEITSTNGVWTPGLYYLHRTDRTTAEDIWAVERMSHWDILNSNIYDVGTVVSSNFTLPSNYVEVRDWFCGDAVDTIVAGDNHYTEVNRSMMRGAGYTNPTRKDVADSSKYYNLSYNNTSTGTIGTGSVTETTAASCLTQRPGGTADADLNQVLVRYNEKNEIVYAISFAHGTATVENAAQGVWRSVALPPDNATFKLIVLVDLEKTAEAQIAALNAADPDYAAKVAAIRAALAVEQAKVTALEGNQRDWNDIDRAAINTACVDGKTAITNAGTGAPATYTVTVAAPTNGTASADVTTAAAGATITITATADTGYKLDTITVTDASGAPVTVTGNTFVMPAQNVTVTVTFVVDGGTTPGENDYTVTFERSAESKTAFNYFNAQVEEVNVSLDVPANKTVSKDAADKTITLTAGADNIPAWKDVCPANFGMRVALKIENGTNVVTPDLYLEPEQKVSVDVTSDMTLTFTYTVIKKEATDPVPDYGTGEGGEPEDPDTPPDFGVVSRAGTRSQLLATQTDYVWILILEGREPGPSASGTWVQWTETDPAVQPDKAVQQNADAFRAKWYKWNYYLWYLSYTYEDGNWAAPEKPTVNKTSTIVEDKQETYKALADAINEVLADDTKTEAEKEAAKVALEEAIEAVKAATTTEEVKEAEENGTTAIETAKPDPLYEAKKAAKAELTTAANTAKTSNPDNAEAIDKALADATAAVDAVETTEADVTSVKNEWIATINALGEATPAKEVTIAIEGESATADKTTANPGDVVTITAADGYIITSAVVGEEGLTISEDGLTATYTVPEDAEGTITITVTTEAVTPANKVTLNLTGTVAMTLPTSVEGTDGTVTFDIVMVNNSYRPKVDTVLNANGNETQVWDSENNVVCKLDTSDAEGKTWNVTVSNVADGMTIKFKHEMRIVVSVAKAGTGADGIVSDITPESCFADGTCTFTFDVLSGMTPSVKDYDAESCKYTPTFTKGASNGNGGYTWTLTVTDIESTTAVTITLITSDEIGVTLTIDETAAGYIDAANTETGYKAIANDTVTFTVKMTRDTVVPKIIDNDGAEVSDGVTMAYDETTGVWTVTITEFDGEEVEFKLGAAAESAVSIVAGTGVASLSRTKVYPCEAVKVGDESKLIFYVKWENGFKAPTSETITYADGTSEWAGWTKVSIAAEATSPVTINGQGAPKATLTIGTDSTSKTAIIFQTGTSMQVEAVYDANSTTTATATFTGIIITDGVNVTVKKVAEGEGGATVVSKATVTKQADGTYTVVIPGVTGDGTYILEAAGLYYFSVQAASGSGITLPDVNQSAYVTSGSATLTVWVDEGRMPTVDSVAGAEVATSAFSVNYNSAASTAGRSAYDISIPAETLNGANANLTVTLKVSGSKSFAITANLDDTLEDGPIWHLGDGMTNLNSSNGVADVVVVMQNGWFPRVTDCDLPAEEGGEDGASISAQAEGDAECTTAYTYEKGASDAAETEWIIHLTNITTATELTITADKAAEILTKDTAGQADNDLATGWKGCLKLLATNYAGTNLSIDEEMDANGKHILNITGTICGWMDKTWWNEINVATGSEEEEMTLTLAEGEIPVSSVLPGYWGGQTDVKAAWEWVKNTLIAEGNLAGLTDNSKLGLICFTLPGNAATTMLIHVTDNPAYHGTVNAGESGAAYEVNVNITFDGVRANAWEADTVVEGGSSEG